MKKVTKNIKVKAVGGKATPAPPLGPTLGQAGINIGDFVTKFNAATKNMMGEDVTVHIAVYEDRSYDFTITSTPVSALIKKTLGIESGSGKPNTSKVGKLTRAQVEEIAKKKMKDLNATDLEGAVKIISGTARSMGVDVK